MQNNAEILSEFTIEAREILDKLDEDFTYFEQNPEDTKLIGNIFRALHTLKGSSGFFAFKRLEKISHAGESLLGKLRDGQLRLNSTIIEKLLQSIDVLRAIIEGIETNQLEPVGDDQELIDELKLLTKNGQFEDHRDPIENNGKHLDKSPFPSSQLVTESKATPDDDTNDPTSDSLDSMEGVSDLMQVAEISFQGGGYEMGSDSSISVRNADFNAPVKVNLETLDRLMNLTGEMVLARNRLLPFANTIEDVNFSQTVRSIDLLTLELQERMMKMRMQPISQVWSKFPRLVRDISTQCHKKVNLIQVGAETELDKTLLDGIRDPLIHIIRNSVDHSIELPNARLAKGKPETASIILRAAHQNGMVVIEIADDGAGIDFDRVRMRAIERGLLSTELAPNISNKELVEYIFLPGFSTKESVTNLSGRGVGMDVVKNNIANIGGSIEISSEADLGVNIKLKIPLTLAIMPALLVKSESEIYAIPQNRILELVQINSSSESPRFEDFHGTTVFRLRDKLVPLLFLNEQLGLGVRQDGQSISSNIVILHAGLVQFGLVVESVLNIQDVVVKPMGPLLKGLPIFAGATILGSGRVSLIIDIDGIAMLSGLVEKIEANPINQVVIQQPIEERKVPMLLFEIAGLEKMAIPLERVEHIIMLDINSIQKNGSKDVIFYQNKVVDVVWLNRYVSGGNPQASFSQHAIPVFICHANQKYYALVVHRVFDIVQMPEKVYELASPQRGLLGCGIFNDVVVNIVDLEEILMLHNFYDTSVVYPKVVDLDG